MQEHRYCIKKICVRYVLLYLKTNASYFPDVSNKTRNVTFMMRKRSFQSTLITHPIRSVLLWDSQKPESSPFTCDLCKIYSIWWVTTLGLKKNSENVKSVHLPILKIFLIYHNFSSKKFRKCIQLLIDWNELK